MLKSSDNFSFCTKKPKSFFSFTLQIKSFWGEMNIFHSKMPWIGEVFVRIDNWEKNNKNAKKSFAPIFRQMFSSFLGGHFEEKFFYLDF